jgi:hypothetical protein
MLPGGGRPPATVSQPNRDKPNDFSIILKRKLLASPIELHNIPAVLQQVYTEAALELVIDLLNCLFRPLATMILPGSGV